jgi:hypothetical protein
MHKSPNPARFQSSLPYRRWVRHSNVGRWNTVLATTCLAAAMASAFPAGATSQDPPSATATQSQSPDDSGEIAAQAPDLSDEVVRDVLTNFQRGIETHNLDRVLDVFDPDGMKDYSQFRDQMTAFFRLHDSIKFRYQLLQVTADKDQGSAVADVDMEAESTDILPTTQRHSTQMRFQLKRVGKVWKVIGLRPQSFFAQ